MARKLSWLLMLVVAVGALVVAAVDTDGQRSDGERAADLARSIACPQCTGQPVSDSDAPIAQVIRNEIRTQVDQGLTDAEVRQIYVDRYGEWVDLTPATSGFTLAVWIVPFLAIGAGLGGLALAFSRWGNSGSVPAMVSDADRELVDAALENRGFAAQEDEGEEVAGEEEQ